MTCFELPTVRVAHTSRKLDGFGEVHPDFLWLVRVRAERDGQALLKRELEDVAAGINLFAILT